MNETIKPDLLKVFLAVWLLAIFLSVMTFIVYSHIDSPITTAGILENLIVHLRMLPVFGLKLIVVSLVSAYLLTFYTKAVISPEGISAYNTMGQRTFMAWSDIAGIKRIPVPGIPLLLLSSPAQKWSIWVSENLTNTPYVDKNLRIISTSS